MPDPFHVLGIMAGIYHDGKYLMMVRSENNSEGPGDLSFVSGKPRWAQNVTTHWKRPCIAKSWRRPE
jgi:hypothetical protein